MNADHFYHILVASASFGAILIAALAVLLTLYVHFVNLLADSIIRKFKKGMQLSLAAFSASIVTTGVSLIGIAGVGSLYWPSIGLFSMTLVLTLISGILIYVAIKG
jgi:hypothetical protein